MEQERRGALREIELPGLAIRQALFLAQDAVRRMRAHEGINEAILDGTSANEPNPERAILSKEQLGRAQRELAKLPKRSAEIFELCYDTNLSHAEAAARLGVSVQHVRQTLYEVRKQLRQCLREEP